MAVDPPDRSQPVTFAGSVLDRYRHVCAFVNDQDEQDAMLDPFVDQGVVAGDQLVYLVDPAEVAVPVNRLRHMGHDAAELLTSHRCDIRTWSDTYLRSGGFDQSDMLSLLDEIFLGQESPRIRMIADMGWAVDRDDDAELIEFEAKANFIHARHNHVVICSYNTTRFDGSFIVDILRTHPMVLLGGMVQENPFFVPPAEFLEERARRAD